MPDSIVREVLTRATEESPMREAAQITGYGADDTELERILSGLRTNIKIVGVGGGGCNTIDRLAEAGVVGAEMYACNTDAQHLLIVRAPHKILFGRRSTRGLGAGALPQVGEEAARESGEGTRKARPGAALGFFTCGLGGGTGTGGAPVIAQVARELGALPGAVCT